MIFTAVAYSLCQQSGDTPQLFSVLAGLRRFYSAKKELQTARELAQQMLSLAQRVRDPALLVEAHHSLGNVLFWSGEFVAAQAQVEQGIACHDHQQCRHLAFWYGIDPGVNCRNFAANVLWFLGYPDQALKRSLEALTLARELAHPHSQAYALGFAATLHQHRQEEHITKEKAEALIALATEHGFQPMLAWGTVLRGWAVARQGQAELIYQRGLPPQASYLFKHALVQDTAYQSLLKSKRQQLHQQIAQALEQRFTETVETHPELLAHHYTEAGLSEQAIPYWQQAGQRAVQRSANVEAISHLTKGLELLAALPDGPERAQQELTLQTTLGMPLVLTRGYAAPEVEATYTRARDLCRQVGETPQLFLVLLGLRRFYFSRGELQTARELGQQLLTLAQNLHDSGLLARAHHMQGEVLSYLGEFVQAREHFEQGVSFYDFQQHRSDAFLYGNDTGVACLALVGPALSSLGYRDQALKRSHEALTRAQELSHPFSLAIALSAAARVHYSRWEMQAAQERAEALIALSTEQGFAFFLAHGVFWQGAALAGQSQGEEGIEQIHRSLVACQAIGVELFRPGSLVLLAEAYGKVGQTEEGLTLLAEALELVDKTGAHGYEAELYRVKGELTLAQSSAQGRAYSVQKEAEECFQQAIEVARHQQAKPLELRAAVSLARLWQQQGKQKEAHHMLAEIYGWFTEGFDTKDLQEAKTLLDELV